MLWSGCGVMVWQGRAERKALRPYVGGQVATSAFAVADVSVKATPPQVPRRGLLGKCCGAGVV